jgi:predicted metal-dependent hydrolase
MDHHTAHDVIERLNRDAERIAAAFGLRYESVEAERANVKRRYGICYADGSIRIRLRHATSGRALKYSSLVNTLCHELAHLRHFNHGKRFRGFYLRLLEFARAQGIYRPSPPLRAPRPAFAAHPEPAPRRAPGPEQLDLFS